MTALKLKFCLALCATCWASGCGSDTKASEGGGDPATTIASTPLAGVVGGQAWSIDHADTEPALSDEETFFLTLYAEPAAACEPFFQSTRDELILIVPKAPGDYAISLARAATFVVDPSGKNDNLVAIRGRLVIEEVTSTSLRGGLSVEYNTANHVNGQFEANVCPPR